SRRLELVYTHAEELRFLESLPATPEELSRVYSLTYCPEIKEHPGVIKVVYDMFGTAARLVHKSGKYHKEFIALVDMTDGELGEIAWPEFDWLLEHDSAKILSAL